MTTLLLTRCWLHTAADLADSLDLIFLDEGETHEAPAEQRRYAGGRLRLITRPGTATTIEVACVKMSRADYLALRARVGSLQLLRLPRGRKLYGFIDSVSPTERRRYDAVDVSFTFREVTWSEGL